MKKVKFCKLSNRRRAMDSTNTVIHSYRALNIFVQSAQ